MSNEALWERLVDAVELKATVTDHGKTEEPLEDRPDLSQQIKFIMFERNSDEYKLEQVTKPRIIDRKSLYHRAAGSQVTFENIYDPDDLAAHINLYIKKDGAWQLLELDNLDLS